MGQRKKTHWALARGEVDPPVPQCGDFSGGCRDEAYWPTLRRGLVKRQGGVLLWFGFIKIERELRCSGDDPVSRKLLLMQEKDKC